MMKVLVGTSVGRLVTGLAVVGTLSAVGLLVAVPAEARSANWQSITLPGGGDSFYNYDFHRQMLSGNELDWPVGLIFGNNATVPKAKRPLAQVMPHPGSIKYAYVSGGWDQDRGLKQRPGGQLCDDPGYNSNFHVRFYAPSGTDRMYNVNYGYFVIGTAHNDFREGCPEPSWFGDSEAAEEFIVRLLRRHFAVHEDQVPLANFERLQLEDGKRWHNSGYATVISIP